MPIARGVELIEVREAAELAHRSAETVRRWVWSGRLAAEKRGNRLLVRKGDVLALIGASPSGAQHDVSLAEWAREAARSTSAGSPGVTASDLVLADRAAREDSDRAGR